MYKYPFYGYFLVYIGKNVCRSQARSIVSKHIRLCHARHVIALMGYSNVLHEETGL